MFLRIASSCDRARSFLLNFTGPFEGGHNVWRKNGDSLFYCRNKSGLQRFFPQKTLTLHFPLGFLHGPYKVWERASTVKERSSIAIALKGALSR